MYYLGHQLTGSPQTRKHARPGFLRFIEILSDLISNISLGLYYIALITPDCYPMTRDWRGKDQDGCLAGVAGVIGFGVFGMACGVDIGQLSWLAGY